VALAAAMPSARLLVVPGSGHATPHDQPAAFNRALLEFLAAH
jgi:pimeloyl-ACP methyl ester carboxylesterase